MKAKTEEMWGCPLNCPEDFDCKVLVDLDSGSGYDWNMFAVIQDNESKRLFWYQGSGCSCNGPSDDFQDLFDLEKEGQEIKHDSFHAFESAIKSWKDDYNSVAFDEIVKAIATAREALEAKTT